MFGCIKYIITGMMISFLSEKKTKKTKNSSINPNISTGYYNINTNEDWPSKTELDFQRKSDVKNLLIINPVLKKIKIL